MGQTEAKKAVSQLLTEDLCDLKQARDEVRAITSKRPDKATLTRWIHRGCSGTHLEAIRLGNQLFTSRQAITRFIVERTAKSVGN